MGTIGRTDAHDPAVAEADEEICKQVWETAIQARATHTLCEPTCDLLGGHPTGRSHTSDNHDQWISNQKVQDLKHLLGDDANTEEGKAFL